MFRIGAAQGGGDADNIPFARFLCSLSIPDVKIGCKWDDSPP